MSNFTLDHFQSLLQTVTDVIKDNALNQSLEDKLNRLFPADGEHFEAIRNCCIAGIESGDLCKYEAGGIKYGRVIKPNAGLQGYSVDVVDMESVAGPHHTHPKGEIDLIMPIDAQAQFDNRSAGWLVYGPGSAHSPTVTQGKALVLYLLPQGEIEFTRQ
ncbi:DUF4863 family protein [Pseudomaricurvus alkylphenolicus]|nr:DUF4863 family protein [Pseudomaricurvus alkylphenolicus]